MESVSFLELSVNNNLSPFTLTMITTNILSVLATTKLVAVLADHTTQLYRTTINAAVNNPSNASAAILACGAYTIFKILTKSHEGRSERLCQELLDDVEQNPLLAMEYLKEGDMPLDVVDEGVIEGGLCCGMEITSVPVKEHRHRRLPHKKSKKDYMQAIIAEIKVKLGTPQNNEANRQIIRRTARGLLEAHGLRPTHQASIMPIIIEAVLTPSNMEMEASMWANSQAVRKRRTGKVGWMEWVFNTSPSTPHC